jgi:hypothetical protein
MQLAASRLYEKGGVSTQLSSVVCFINTKPYLATTYNKYRRTATIFHNSHLQATTSIPTLSWAPLQCLSKFFFLASFFSVCTNLFRFKFYVGFFCSVTQHTVHCLQCYSCSAGTDGCGNSFNKNGAGVTIPTYLPGGSTAYCGVGRSV